METIAWLLCWTGWIVTIWIGRVERRELLNRVMARDYHEYATMERNTAPKARENWLEKSIKDAYRQKAKQAMEETDE